MEQKTSAKWQFSEILNDLPSRYHFLKTEKSTVDSTYARTNLLLIFTDVAQPKLSHQVLKPRKPRSSLKSLNNLNIIKFCRIRWMNPKYYLILAEDFLLKNYSFIIKNILIKGFINSASFLEVTELIYCLKANFSRICDHRNLL